jgi:CRISPR-associated protein (TIGR02584 family)
MADFAPQQRHLLIALLGRTPQILTETLYALCVDQGVPISEIWVISTYEEYQLALEKWNTSSWSCWACTQRFSPKRFTLCA